MGWVQDRTDNNNSMKVTASGQALMVGSVNLTEGATVSIGSGADTWVKPGSTNQNFCALVGLSGTTWVPVRVTSNGYLITASGAL